MTVKKQNLTDFRIVSAQVKITFECPHCGEEIEIMWSDVDCPESWFDIWPAVDCPECGKSVELGEWEYD